MLEYCITRLPVALKKALKEKAIDIIEEKFSGRRSWLVYTSAKLERLLNKHGVGFEVKDVSETGWESRWYDYLEDGWLTDSAYFCFQDKCFDDERTLIRINPALAFGTGSHATTQIAARLMEPVVKGSTVLDIGTGSGILSILASMKGAKAVYSCDIDPVALHNTTENIRLNHCDNIHIWAGGIESVNPNVRFGVVVANIITSVLTVLHPHILTLTPKYIIYSGITKKEGSSFLSSLNLHGYQPDALLHMKEWSGLRFKMIP